MCGTSRDKMLCKEWITQPKSERSCHGTHMASEERLHIHSDAHIHELLSAL